MMAAALTSRFVQGPGAKSGKPGATSGAPAPQPDTIRVFVLGMCMGIALCQHGHLVLHGNTVQVGDACMCAVGASGAGRGAGGRICEIRGCAACTCAT